MLRRFLFTFSIVASIIIIFSVIITQKREKRRAFEANQKELTEKVFSLRKMNEKLKRRIKLSLMIRYKSREKPETIMDIPEREKLLTKNTNLIFQNPRVTRQRSQLNPVDWSHSCLMAHSPGRYL